MGARMRAMDWTLSDVGPPSGWPQSLRTAVSICLNCRFPIVLFWGDRFIHFYNDEYRAILGSKHPALGKPASEIWPEIWSVIGPMLHGVRQSGQATRERDLLLPMRRGNSDDVESCWFSFSYSPIVDETGRVGGVFCPVIETTETVKAQRSLQAEGGRLKDLFEQAPGFMAVTEGPDHRFVQANRVFEQLFGPRPLIGRTFREAFPDLEGQPYFDLLDSVFRSGRAARSDAAPISIRRPGRSRVEDCFVDMVYQPIRDADGSINGIFVEGVDVTGRVERDRRDACLKEIERVARNCVDPEDIARSGTELLATHMKADRCAYAEVDSDQDGFTITGAYTPDMPSVVGTYRMSSFGVAALDHMHRGIPWIVEDYGSDARIAANEKVAYEAIGMQAVVCVPLYRSGRFVACMAVHSRTPRSWLEADVGLLVAVAARCWESIERARITRELRANESRFRSLVQSTSQIFWTADPTGDLVEDSPSWRTFTGQTLEQMRGAGWLSALHPDDRGVVGALWRDAVARGAPVDREYRLRHADGTWRWTQVHVIPVRDAAGAVVEWVGMNTDITQRRRAEQRDAFLLRLEDSMRSRSDPDEVAYTSMRMLCEEMGADRATYFEADPDGRFGRVMRDYAPGIVSLSGDHSLLDYGESFAVAMHSNQPLVLDDRDEADLTPEQYARFEEIQIGAAIVVPLHKDGKLSAVLGLYQGLPRRWSAEEVDLTRLVAGRCWESIARARVSRELQEADRRKDEFIATLAHELRNPLAPLRNGLAVLTRNAPGISAERLFPMMERQVDHLVRMVDDLLDVSRITRGKIEIRRECLDLAEVIRNAIDTSRPWLESARHHFDLRLPAQPVIVKGDSVRLTQVFANLLNNASKFTRAGGNISLELWTEAGRALVCVTDDGVGIEPEMRSRVFEIFAQVPGAQHRPGDGLGIGLSLVKSIVALHDGAVSVDSEGLGKGSRFQISLPLAQQADVSGLRVSGPDQSGHRELKRVLVVDDNRDSADSIAMVLTALGADVRVAYDGSQGLELAESYRPSIALLDIGMPEMDGYELARRIRSLKAGPQMTLVALTGWGQEDDQRRSREAGFDRHLVKPADFELLREIVTAH